ncbi:MAG: DUF2079 domain-containing protein [Planctomycetota bacterium]|nr:MAG: DUF2079 domain-containing protein [Planctomycetota bacterium]
MGGEPPEGGPCAESGARAAERREESAAPRHDDPDGSRGRAPAPIVAADPREERAVRLSTSSTTGALSRVDLPWLALVLLCLCVVSALLSLEGIRRVERLGYASPDDAMVVQALWNTTHGRWFASSIERSEPPWEQNHLGTHFDLSLPLQVPLAWIAPGYRSLLWVHPLVGLLGVIPLFVYARRRLGSPRLAAAAACLALASPLLLTNTLRLGLYSWLVPPCVLFALERLDAGRRRAAAVGFLLATLCREDVAFPVAAFLLVLAATSPAHRRFALCVAAACLAWLTFVLAVLGPWLAPGMHHLARYAHLGGSAGEILLSPLLHPAVFFSHLFSGESLVLGFLLLFPFLPCALLSPRHLFAAAMPWAMVAVSSKASDKVLGHYLVPALPFLFAAAVAGVARARTLAPQRWGSWRVRVPFVGLALTWCTTAAAWTCDAGPLRRYQALRVLGSRATLVLEAMTPEHAALRAVLSRVPAEASVSAAAPTLILLAKRRWLHPFPVRAHEADVLVIDTDPSSPRYPDYGSAAHSAAVRRALSEAGARSVRIGRFAVVDRRGVPK